VNVIKYCRKNERKRELTNKNRNINGDECIIPNHIHFIVENNKKWENTQVSTLHDEMVQNNDNK